MQKIIGIEFTFVSELSRLDFSLEKYLHFTSIWEGKTLTKHGKAGTIGIKGQNYKVSL